MRKPEIPLQITVGESSPKARQTFRTHRLEKWNRKTAPTRGARRRRKASWGPPDVPEASPARRLPGMWTPPDLQSEAFVRAGATTRKTARRTTRGCAGGGSADAHALPDGAMQRA